MSYFISKLATITHKLNQLALHISAMGLVLMTIIISWQVFARYILNNSPAWSESVALLLMLYYILIAAAVGVYEGFHLGMKAFVDAAPKNFQLTLEIINHILVLIFGIAMFINGARLAGFTSDHLIPTLNISRAVAYWPFTISGLLISLFAFERILIITSRKEK